MRATCTSHHIPINLFTVTQLIISALLLHRAYSLQLSSFQTEMPQYRMEWSTVSNDVFWEIFSVHQSKFESSNLSENRL